MSTSHNITSEANAEKTEMAERRADFLALAEQRYAQYLETGESIPWEDARTWLKQQMPACA